MNSQLPAVQAFGLVKTFGGRGGAPEVAALRGVTIEIASGRMTAIVGPSGCGKSTLLYALAGLDLASQGRVLVNGHDLGQLKPDQLSRLYRDSVGFVFQSFNLIPSLTAVDNVVISDRLAGRPVDPLRALDLLRVVGLEEQAGSRISVLSNGQQQRVAVARVLYARPQIVFADEPTGALDTSNAALVLDHLRHYADAGHTVAMVTHDLEAACRADEVLVMRDGVITHAIARPSPDQLLPLISDSGTGSPR